MCLGNLTDSNSKKNGDYSSLAVAVACHFLINSCFLDLVYFDCV